MTSCKNAKSWQRSVNINLEDYSSLAGMQVVAYRWALPLQLICKKKKATKFLSGLLFYDATVHSNLQG